MSRALAPALFLLLAAATARAGDSAAPVYEMPDGLAAPAIDSRLDEAARAAVAAILDPASPSDADDAVRLLAGLGRAALPHVVGGLTGASWCSRAALVGAVSEMDEPGVTPLLVTACRDPAFAVREAAVAGLGKTGDAAGAAALAERAAPSSEPAWRVRAAAARAIRRAVLRGAMDRALGESSLTGMLADADEDVRRAALREIAPLAAAGALPAILAIFEDPLTSSPDRTLALAALRTYRAPTPELLAALRRGFLAGEDEREAVEAGRALLAMRGVAALDDEEVSRAVVYRLHEAEHVALREGLARLGRLVAPWLRARALDLAGRIASARETHAKTAFDEILDTLIQVDEAAGLALVTEFLAGPAADSYDREVRLAALRKVEFVFAPRMRAELRALLDSKAGSDLRSDVLRAIVASGGDDLAAILDAALGDPKSRFAALELLDRRADLAAGPKLRAMAAGAPDPKERRAAIETLSRRDPAAAARIAADLLGDARAAMREKAIDVLSASREPADFERLLARLAKEDGSDPPPPRPAAGEGEQEGTTPSEHSTGLNHTRRKLVCALLSALKTAGGERARTVLLRVAESDTDGVVRETAVKQLQGLALASDAPKLVALLAAEPDQNARREILRALARLGTAPEAVARLDALVADPRSRAETLRLLAEAKSSVVTERMTPGLTDPAWNDDERRDALVALDRAGRAPSVAALAALLADARTNELCGEAAHVLATREDPAAGPVLIGFLGTVSQPERLASIVDALAERGDPEAEAPLIALFDALRERAFAARLAVDPSLDLYRRCADAVADFGSERTGESLVAHLLDPRLARAAAECCREDGGAFFPIEAAPVSIVRTLAAAFARLDDATCSRLLASRLAASAATGADLQLPEAYVAGVARYLHHPLAHDLPARPRPAAALHLWRQTIHNAPRMSAFDLLARQESDDELGQERRYVEAAATLRGLVALADVEDASRSRETRLVEAARIAVRTAQALAADGRRDEALAVARAVRAPDPASGELAYRQAWCLARIGGVETEARDLLREAAAQDDKDARIHFQIAWLTEGIDGAERSLRDYDQAVRLDRKRVEERSGDDAAGGSDAPYETAAYAYWYARALRSAGRDDWAHGYLAAAVALDDRLAAQAIADAAFKGWDRLEAAVGEGLTKIRRGALR